MTVLYVLALLLSGAIISDYIRIRKQNTKLRRNVAVLSEYVAKHYGLDYTYWLMNKEEDEWMGNELNFLIELNREYLRLLILRKSRGSYGVTDAKLRRIGLVLRQSILEFEKGRMRNENWKHKIGSGMHIERHLHGKDQ